MTSSTIPIVHKIGMLATNPCLVALVGANGEDRQVAEGLAFPNGRRRAGGRFEPLAADG